MNRTVLCAIAVAILAVGSTHARDLKFEKKVSLTPGETHSIFFDAPLVEKATVAIKSPDAPVTVYLVLSANAEEAVKAIDTGKTPKNVLAAKEKVQEATLEIDPGKKPFVVLLVAGKKTVVQLKVTGK